MLGQERIFRKGPDNFFVMGCHVQNVDSARINRNGVELSDSIVAELVKSFDPHAESLDGFRYKTGMERAEPLLGNTAVLVFAG